MIGPQVRLNPTVGSTRANETSAAAAEQTEVVAGWNDYSNFRTVRTGVAVSLDGETGATRWFGRLTVNQADIEGDPMVAGDPRTGHLWVGGIAFGDDGGVFVARKQPGATTFEPSVTTYVSAYSDKGWMAAGPRPGMPDTTRLYLVYNLGVQFSDDLGDSWSPPASVGLGHRLSAQARTRWNPLHRPIGTASNRHMLKKSTDGGQTFAPRRPSRRSWMCGISATRPRSPVDSAYRSWRASPWIPPMESLFCVYFDTSSSAGGESDVDLWLTRSDDGGEVWTPPVVISEDPEPAGDQFFPWIEIDAEGRLHLLYLDTSLTTTERRGPTPGSTRSTPGATTVGRVGPAAG